MKGGKVPKHLGGDSTLRHSARSTKEPELGMHPRVKWFEVGGQGRGERAGCPLFNPGKNC